MAYPFDGILGFHGAYVVRIELSEDGPRARCQYESKKLLN